MNLFDLLPSLFLAELEILGMTFAALLFGLFLKMWICLMRAKTEHQRDAESGKAKKSTPENKKKLAREGLISLNPIKEIVNQSKGVKGYE